MWFEANSCRFDRFYCSHDDFEAQMSPFDFLRQEMLRPFQEIFGSGRNDGKGGGGGLFGGNLFEGMEEEFAKMPGFGPGEGRNRQRSQRATSPPPTPPHYSFHPTEERSKSDTKVQTPQEGTTKKDIFEGYSGRVEEI